MNENFTHLSIKQKILNTFKSHKKDSKTNKRSTSNKLNWIEENSNQLQKCNIVLKYGNFRTEILFYDKDLSKLKEICLNFIKDKIDGFCKLEIKRMLLFLVNYCSKNMLQLIENVNQIQNGNIVEIITIDEKIASEDIKTQHTYIIQRFKRNTICDYCGISFSGLMAQGLKCKGCDCNYHKNCSKSTCRVCFYSEDFTTEPITDQISKIKKINDGYKSLRSISNIKKNESSNISDLIKKNEIFSSGLLNDLHLEIYTDDRDVNDKKKSKIQLSKNKKEVTLRSAFGTIKSIQFKNENNSEINAKSRKYLGYSTYSEQDLNKERSRTNSFKKLSMSIKNSKYLRRLFEPKSIKPQEATSAEIFKGWLIYGKETFLRNAPSYWILEKLALIIYDSDKMTNIIEKLYHGDITSVEENFTAPKLDSAKPPYIFILKYKDETTLYCGQREEFLENGRLVNPSFNSGVGTKHALQFYELLHIAMEKGSIMMSNEVKDIVDGETIDTENKLKKNYEINYSALLGSGQFGKVYQGCNIKTKKEVAIKIIDKSKYETNSASLDNETEILQVLNHPCITSLYKVLNTSEKMYLIMERMYGDMLEYILKQKTGSLTEKCSKFLVYQIVIAIKYLHSQNIAHCDLKPENVLLTNINSVSGFPLVKLCDFGFAKIIDEKTFKKSIVGTPAYLAPEVIEDRKYDKNLDIWSIGVIIYVSLSGTFPFSQGDNVREIVRTRNKLFPREYWAKISNQAIDLVERTLKINPKLRPKIFQILAHDWLNTKENYKECRSAELFLEKRYLTEESADEFWNEKPAEKEE